MSALPSPRDRRGRRVRGDTNRSKIGRFERIGERSFRSFGGTRVADLRPRPALPETCLRYSSTESTSFSAPAGRVAASEDLGRDACPHAAAGGRRRPRSGHCAREPRATPPCRAFAFIAEARLRSPPSTPPPEATRAPGREIFPGASPDSRQAARPLHARGVPTPPPSLRYPPRHCTAASG